MAKVTVGPSAWEKTAICLDGVQVAVDVLKEKR